MEILGDKQLYNLHLNEKVDILVVVVLGDKHLYI